MRETALSTCEKTFVEKAIIEKIRVDSRNLMEFRSFGLFFGRDFGSVVCSLGETRVFAQVSCELTTPKATRPNEGTIFINAEMGPMAAPNLEIGFPLTDSCIQINRILERTLRESRCVDLESLCIIAEEKVWNLRVDISVLNHEGNVMDCACIAAVAALAHFKRPDVTTTGDGSFKIHTPAEKDLVPIVLHHYPICVSFALFCEGKIPVADPTVLEERVSDATLVLAVNSYKELCCMHLAGVSLTSPALISRCSELAAVRSRKIVDVIKATLEQDQANREKGILPKGFAESIELSRVPSNFHNEETIAAVFEEESSGMEDDGEDEKPIVGPLNKVHINAKTIATVELEESSSDEASSEDEHMPEVKAGAVKSTAASKGEDGSNSEEEEVQTLHS